ncbi:hypothetical protein JCGZ_07581 [Jatropha curcas]|uniref:Dicer-like 104 n=1 Tax=Jatropha curcas TaxID=180498 RepID=A0A067KNZ1_JATCU|nr:hypothetical protein JCGZ_07581 [Jatropha curcas]
MPDLTPLKRSYSDVSKNAPEMPSVLQTLRFYDKNSSDLKPKIESLWSKAVKVCLQNAPNSNKECEIYREISLKGKSFLGEILTVISESLPYGDGSFSNLGFDYLQALGLGYISTKLYELLQVFLSFGVARKILCLIFVDSILTADVIGRFVKKITALAHFTVSYVTGTNCSVDTLTPKTQREPLESFSFGMVNLLFYTDVLRDGIHVPNCSFVICLDVPKTVNCYVQSRGCARRNDSQYIIMLERGNVKQRNQIFDFIRREWVVTNMVINRDPDVWTPKACIAEETEADTVDGTGSSVIEDDHLLPLVEETAEDDLIIRSEEISAGAVPNITNDTMATIGTTKRNELHGTTNIHALSGSWAEKLDRVTFHAYKFDFSCSIATEIYSGFVLLLASKLDGDVGNIELELYLIRKTVKASVAYCGQKFFKNSLLGVMYCNDARERSSISTVGLSVTECNGTNAIHFADILVDADKLKDMVVLAIHTGKIYSVVEVLSNTSAKYGIVLKYPGQPLLLLKQSHKPHNLLRFADDEDDSKDGMDVEKLQHHAQMPPELLVPIDVSIQTLRSFYLLPSVMNRLESLMLATQLRQEIGCYCPNFHIPSSLILEAITSLRCNEAFSMERLELLGDSVLKYAGYIRDSAFNPRCWVAPGQRPTHYVPCECGVDTLEVPLDAKFQAEGHVFIGKCCSIGHGWMCSKTISDCVEAIIGAYYVSGGLMPTIHVMKWFGIDVEFDLSLRLEFLGDSVLDLLITWHLYRSHPNTDPGELTDLRSACVNNENFAQIVGRKDLYKHLQHCSVSLLSKIEVYLQSFCNSDEAKSLGLKGPKPLLSPIATPESLELPPLRELTELCDFNGYFIKKRITNEKQIAHAELRLQLNDVLLVGDGYEQNKKSATGKAASFLLEELEKYTSEQQKNLETQLSEGSSRVYSIAGSVKHSPQVIKSIGTKKGGPQQSPFELCKKVHCTMPKFDTISEYRASTPKICDEGGKGTEDRTNFVAKVTLNIPSYGIV